MSWDTILPIIYDGLFAAIAAIGFAVISNPPRMAIPVSALLAAIGHAFRFYLITNGYVSITIASLAAAFCIGMLSMLFAKWLHCPAEIFSFPSLLPMIPGMYAYKAILALLQFMSEGRGNEALDGLMSEVMLNGLTAVFIMSALVIGVSLPMFLFHKQSFMMTRLLKAVKK